MLKKIVSGAQTGADRGALDAAIELGYDTGGWIPGGRLAEDGTIPECYQNLKETPEQDYDIRTEWNIRDSDATLIVSCGPLAGGSLYTQIKAEELGKPCLHMDLEKVDEKDAVEKVKKWLGIVRPYSLNVAGPRASKDPYIYEKTRELLRNSLL